MIVEECDRSRCRSATSRLRSSETPSWLAELRLEEGVSFRRRTALGRERVAPCLLALTRRSPMAARYKSRAIAEYAPERIPELCGAVTGRSHASSAQGAWSDWVNDLPGNLPQLTPASMLMPLVAQLPPPDMRLPPKPIRRLDPAALRHFHLQAVAGAPPPATAIDGGPLPAQAVASQEAASSSLSGRSSADGSQKSVSRTEAISVQLKMSNRDFSKTARRNTYFRGQNRVL